MPYSGPNDAKLPNHIQKLSESKRKQFVSVFNEVYAECQEEGGDDCEGEAMRIANGSVKRSERPMNWFTRLVDRLRRATPAQRSLALDLIMAQVYKRLYEMEDVKGPDGKYHYYGLFRVLLEDDGGLAVILNDSGQLYRSAVLISADGQVSLGDLEPVLESYQPVSRGTVRVIRQADGSARIYMIAATAILNRVNEIDSRTLFDNMIRHAEETGLYPSIDVHHTGLINPEVFDIGQIDYLARFGVCYVASGVLDESKELGRRMVRALERESEEDPWGCSIEYYPLDHEVIEVKLRDNGTIPVDVYTDGVNTRISLLPERRAANWFTTVTREKPMAKQLTAQALQTLRNLFDNDEEFNAFIEDVAGVNGDVEQRGLVHREQDEETEATEPPQTETTERSMDEPVDEEEREVVLDDHTLAVIADMVIAKLNPQLESQAQQRAQEQTKLDQILEAVQGLTKTVQGQEARLKKLERSQDDVVTEVLEDLSPKVKGRMLVTYRPSQPADPTATETADQIASRTLSSLPNLLS